MKQLNPHTIPLESINLIEASAGTGKSWTVTLLYLRLILEKGLTVDQILVVTFTDAATKELRDAVRDRLVDALQFFENPEIDAAAEYIALYQTYANNTDDLAVSIHRLKRAKLSVDEAAIFTIHSFCQRALTENAFEASLPFESELMDDDRELMQKLTDDFWRRRFQKAPPALIFKLQQKSITPDSLLKDIRLAVGKPYLKICGPLEDVDNQKFTQMESAFQAAVKTWCEKEREIKCLLCDPSKEAEYNKTFVKSRDFVIREMENLAHMKSAPKAIDSKLSWLGQRDKTTAKFESLEHSFFLQWQEFYDHWNELNKLSDDFINQIRIDLIEYLQEELPKEKQRLGVLSFDDLLLQLQSALRHQPELANKLRQKYQAALIDEFQDTDPVQYEIFSTIYQRKNANAVFLVGDPKQAIYSFRGGDIHTYLEAKSHTIKDNRYTLKKNWRSHPQLIEAFNQLYADCDNPFYDKGIEYVEVEAGDRITEDLITPDQRAPLRFWQAIQSDDKPSAKDIRKDVATAVAGDIAELLNAAEQGDARIGDVPISGGDIAVLIRSHSQGDLIKSALNARGIASVQSSKDSIFETHEAAEIIILLTAIVEPQREDNVRRALVTELMGKCAADLLAYENDSGAWEDQLLAMQSWHYQWKEQGFLPMMRELMRAEKLHQHLMAYDDGERRITNVLHLSELIHQQSRKQSLSMEEVLRWLRQQQENASQSEAELRLESDEKLVKIVTIHKSKGLEYPIVYCPFVGISGKAKSDKIFTFHKNDETCLEIGSAEASDHKAIKKLEESAEDARLLYVALTRAKYQCTVVCAPEIIKGAPDRTALAWLLSDGKAIQSGNSKAATGNNADFFVAYNARLKKLSESDGISLVELPQIDENLRYKTQQTTQILNARRFSAEIKSQAQVTSFSGLTADAHNELPDYDANAEPKTALPPLADNEFPRGSTAGSCLHEIYENLDFSVSVEAQADVISDALKKWNFDEKHHAAASILMQDSLETELFEGFSLSQLSNENRLNEMEFYLPLERLQIDDLQQVLFKHLPKDWLSVRDAVKTLSFEQVEGYLKGFIDLIFEHEGKFYVVDYKSNSLNDYSAESLLPVMADSHYYLQYLLYSVALHRYLKKRVPDYQWETHIGGAYYLFIRGMMPKNVENRGGVFENKPNLALIEALDGLFMESFL